MASRRIQNTLLAVPLLAFAAVVAWFSFGSEDGAPAVDDPIYRPEPKGPAAPVQIEVAPGVLPAAKGGVEVALQVVARALPAPPPRPHCVLVSSLQSGSDRGIPGEWVAGLAAVPLARRIRGQQLVRFRLENGADHYRVTRLRSDDDGPVALVRGRMTITNGKVLDDAGRPVRDARIWLAGFATTTDADGCFAIDALPADSGLPLVVRKPGFTPHYRVLTGAQYAALAEQPVVLQRGVELSVRFAGGVAEAGRYFLLPAGGRDTRLLGYPFFFAAIEPMHRLRSDTVVFDGLPKGARVRVAMLRPGFAPATSAEIRLDRDAVGAMVTCLARPRVRGTVTDESGRPVDGAWLTTRAGSSGLSLRDTGWLLPPVAYVAGGDVVQTGADGTFALSRLSDEEGRTALAVESPGSVGLTYALAGSGDEEVAVRLFAPRPEGPRRLLLQRGPGLPERVRLTVRDESGEHGPYSWQGDQPFPIRIRHPSVLRIQVRVDGKDPVVLEDVLVVGETPVTVAGAR